MRCNLRSDKSFAEYLRSRPSFAVIIAVALLGLLLIIASSVTPSVEDKSEEESLSEICSSIEGVGRCRTVITYAEEDGEVFAVAVLCEGADSVFVKERVYKLITSLYGIGSNRVAVLKIE